MFSMEIPRELDWLKKQGVSPEEIAVVENFAAKLKPLALEKAERTLAQRKAEGADQSSIRWWERFVERLKKRYAEPSPSPELPANAPAVDRESR